MGGRVRNEDDLRLRVERLGKSCRYLLFLCTMLVHSCSNCGL